MGRNRMKDTSQTIPFNTNNTIACKRFMEAKIDGNFIIMGRKYDFSISISIQKRIHS